MTTPRTILRIITSCAFERLSNDAKNMIVKYCQHPENIQYLNIVSESLGGGLVPVDTNFTKTQYTFVNICTKVDEDNIDLIEQMFGFAHLFRNEVINTNDSDMYKLYERMYKSFELSNDCNKIDTNNPNSEHQTRREMIDFCYQWVRSSSVNLLCHLFKEQNYDFVKFKKFAIENGVWVASMSVLEKM